MGPSPFATIDGVGELLYVATGSWALGGGTDFSITVNGAPTSLRVGTRNERPPGREHAPAASNLTQPVEKEQS